MASVVQAMTAAALVIAAPATAQVTEGDFSGAIEVAPGQKLRLALHLFQAQEGGGLVGSLDSLDQGARGIAISDLVVDRQGLRFTVPMVGGSYRSSWDTARGAWTGSWSQGGRDLPLDWTPTKAEARPPLAAQARWTMPEPATVLEPLVAAEPTLAIALGTVDGKRLRTAVRGGSQHPATANTRFEIGSITKIFTDMLLAAMVARCEVRLDDPVRALLPSGTLADHGNRPITLRDLASHYSGLPRLPANLQPTDPADPYAGYDEAKLHAFLQGWKPGRKPGAMFEYSNLGVGLLGHAHARRAGKPYETLLTERILEPLGMSRTDFSDEGLATPHGEDGKPVRPWRLSSLAAAGGLRSTVGDMTRFAAALLDPPAPLRPAVRLLLDQPLRPAGGSSRIGLGLLSVPTSQGPVLNHDGGTGGMRSSLWLDPARKRAVVLLSNSAAGRAPGAIAVETLGGVKLPQPKPE